MSTKWLKVPNVREHLNASVEHALGEVRENIPLVSAFRCEKVESPIEAIFAVWWTALTSMTGEWADLCELHPQYDVTTGSGKRYRLDFAVLPADRILEVAELRRLAIPRFGVELDGHDFHEKTKEQVTARNQRDRDLSSVGWKMLHISGSELHRNPVVCVKSVLETCGMEVEHLRYSMTLAERAPTT